MVFGLKGTAREDLRNELDYRGKVGKTKDGLRSEDDLCSEGKNLSRKFIPVSWSKL